MSKNVRRGRVGGRIAAVICLTGVLVGVLLFGDARLIEEKRPNTVHAAAELPVVYQACLPPPPTYEVSTPVVAEGDGTVTQEPAGTQFQEGDEITLTATPTPDPDPDIENRFDRWEDLHTYDEGPGVTSTQNPVRYGIGGHHTPRCFFIRWFRLRVFIEGSGDVELVPDPLFSYQLFGTSHFYKRGTEITLTAVPEPGWMFDRWAYAPSGEPSPTTLVMNTPKWAKAVFVPENQSELIVQFAGAESSGIEGAGPVDVLVTLAKASGRTITANYTLSGGAGPGPGPDYAPVSGTVSFAPGETSQIITVDIADDTDYELNEPVSVVLCNVQNGTLGASSIHTLTIIDNDAAPQAAFTLAESAVDEDASVATIAVSLTNASYQTVSASYAATGGTASGQGADYSLPAGTLDFDPGVTSRTFDVAITPDTQSEDDETVTIDLSNLVNASPGAPGSHVLTILDDDDLPAVSFTTSETSGSEDAGTLLLTLELSSTSPSDVSVPFTVLGTAEDGTDYTISSSPATIQSGQLSAQIEVGVLEDTIDELDENLVVTLGTPTNAVLGAISSHTVTITDNDAAPSVAFAAGASSLAEDAGTTGLVVALSAVSGLDVTVPFTCAGTAGPGEDYTVGASPVTIPAGSLSASIDVSAVDDALDESDETVEVTLGTPTNTALGTPAAHTVTLTDNDPPPSVTFSQASLNSLENAGTVGLVVTLSEVSGQDVTVPFTVSGSAIEPDDYTIDPSPLTIAAGSVSETITIAISNDVLHEADETVIVTMGAPVNATPGAVTESTLTIQDNDAAPTVEFVSATSNYSEGDLVVGVTLSLSEVSGLDVTVPFTVAGTATDPNDYTISASPVVISAGTTEATIDITLFGDTLAEGDETVEIALGTPANADLGAIAAHILTIQDDESTISVAFDVETASIGEDQSQYLIAVSLSGPSAQTVTVDYSVTDGTAVGAGADYTLIPDTLQFLPEETSKTISVALIDDTLDESDETIIVSLANPQNCSLGVTHNHTVTLTDDDPEPEIAFELADSVEDEAAGPVSLTVRLTPASGKTVTVDYTVAGSATAADHDLVAGSLIFSPEDEVKTIDFNLVDDLFDEDPDDIVITLVNPANATLGAVAVHTLTIADDDPEPAVAFSTATSGASEGSGLLPLLVELSSESGRDVTLPFSFSGTANVDDYTQISTSPIVIEAGETSASIEFSVDEDLIVEGDETIVVTLGTPQNAVLGVPSEHVVIVSDNDEAQVARWHFNETSGSTAADASVYGHTLSLTSPQADLDTPGVLDSGMLVTPGTTPAPVAECIENGDTPLDLSATATIMAWVKLGSAGQSQTILSKRTAIDATNGYELVANPPGNNARGLMLRYGDETASVSVLSNEFDFTVGEWHHIAVAFDNGDVAFYLDGTPVGTSVGNPSAFAVNDERLRVGAGPGDSFHFDGALDELVIYRTALDSAEIIDEFDNVTHVLTVNVPEGGTVILDPPGGTYTHNQAVTLTPAPDSAWEFVEWTGDLTGNDNPALLTMNGDKAVTAIFVPRVSFALSNSSVNENAGPAQLEVVLSATSNNPITVNCATADASATAGEDYTAESGVVTFDPLEVSRFIDVSITNDEDDDDDETFLVSLSAPSGAVLAEPVSHQVAIIDDDDPPVPEVHFDLAASSVGEGTPAVFVVVELSESAPGTVSVHYAVSGGSATGGGADYTLADGILEFTTGVTTQNIEILLHEDTIVEGDETIVLDLSTPSPPGALILGAPVQHTLTIIDNDTGGDEYPNLVPEITGPPDGTKTKAGQSVEITLTITNTSALHSASGPEWVDAVFVSRDAVLDPADKELARAGCGVSGLLPGEDYTQTLTISVMPDISPGPYYLIVKPDADNILPENDETSADAIAIVAVDPVLTNE